MWAPKSELLNEQTSNQYLKYETNQLFDAVHHSADTMLRSEGRVRFFLDSFVLIPRHYNHAMGSNQGSYHQFKHLTSLHNSPLRCTIAYLSLFGAPLFLSLPASASKPVMF